MKGQFVAFGLVERPWSTVDGEIPRHFSIKVVLCAKANHECVFVDESGDFGPYSKHSPYYILSMVFHDQRVSIDASIQKLGEALGYIGLEHHAVHTAPLIRREADYADLALTDRKKIFMLLYNFVRTCDIHYAAFAFEKKEADMNKFPLVAAMSKTLSGFLLRNQDFFSGYDELIVYYDNGQSEINMLLNAIFNTRPVKVSFRREG